uniref:Uncharacterized protein n=1 Tax=viral metagenome TaxID=1070528 RepID=A0A6M3L2I5_9ZZZZ
MSYPSWTIVEYEGLVAVELPWQVDWNRPVEFRTLRVSNCPFEQWKRFAGEEVRFRDGRAWTFSPDGRPLRMNVEGWETVTVEREIRKPRRRTRHYDWVWADGRWEQVVETEEIGQ